MQRLVFVACVLFIALHVQPAQGQALQNVVVSYPSKSITSFPILDTARRKGFFQQQGLSVNLV